MDNFNVFAQEKIVSWRTPSLTFDKSGSYWAVLFKHLVPAITSNVIQISITEKWENSTGRQQLQYTTLSGNYINTNYSLSS